MVEEHGVRVRECRRQRRERRGPSADSRAFPLPVLGQLLAGRGHDVADFVPAPCFAARDGALGPSEADVAAGGVGLVPVAEVVLAAEGELAGFGGAVEDAAGEVGGGVGDGGGCC